MKTRRCKPLEGPYISAVTQIVNKLVKQNYFNLSIASQSVFCIIKN